MRPLSQWDARTVPFGEGPEMIQNWGGGGVVDGKSGFEVRGCHEC